MCPGFEVLERIRSGSLLSLGVPFIFLTAFSQRTISSMRVSLVAMIRSPSRSISSC